MTTPADEDIRIWQLWLQGMSPNAISELIGKPVETVYERLKYCQKQLMGVK